MCKSDCEWYVRKLGMGRGRRRIWLKLHLEMDEARKEIVAIDFNDERCSWLIAHALVAPVICFWTALRYSTGTVPNHAFDRN